MTTGLIAQIDINKTLSVLHVWFIHRAGDVSLLLLREAAGAEPLACLAVEGTDTVHTTLNQYRGLLSLLLLLLFYHSSQGGVLKTVS